MNEAIKKFIILIANFVNPDDPESIEYAAREIARNFAISFEEALKNLEKEIYGEQNADI